jgi:hypothetical protein
MVTQRVQLAGDANIMIPRPARLLLIGVGPSDPAVTLMQMP